MTGSLVKEAGRMAGRVASRAVRRAHEASGWKYHRRLTVEGHPESGCLRVSDTDASIFVGRAERVSVQAMGILPRQRFLFDEYTQGNVTLRDGDLVIDCGANIGEFSLACERQGAHVHAFEPDPTEFAALSLNATDRIICRNAALWHEQTTLEFFLNNESGDSSVLKPFQSSRSISVEALRLDAYLAQHAPERPVRLLKLEAEGAEPEVLQGADGALERIEYIAADVGPERGLEKASTLVEVANPLIERGFRFVSFNPERCTMLMRNTRA